MKTLKEIGSFYKTDKVQNGYMEHYDSFFSPLRLEKLNVLEIGVKRESPDTPGACSLKAWKEYFPNSNIYGIDIDAANKVYEEERVEIFIGDQGDKDFLSEIIAEFRQNNIRTSVFLDPDLSQVEGAKEIGADRIELYTEAFAYQYCLGNKAAIEPYTKCAELANKINIGVNAGHDLSLENIKFFKNNIPGLLEVSIGHALISESLYLGVENVVQMYLHRLK